MASVAAHAGENTLSSPDPTSSNHNNNDESELHFTEATTTLSPRKRSSKAYDKQIPENSRGGWRPAAGGQPPIVAGLPLTNPTTSSKYITALQTTTNHENVEFELNTIMYLQDKKLSDAVDDA
ncbi:hypothetical protein RND71_028542 [Anisodus tanguticus]|uniref:Uncharacterized protein n=1 Tax=Anisodus tanguticus TaxID=243964 RepID=A0AAE1RIL9_9SOLA|nr:hypothetical protein RND71_028542 [Anisodus tanguticus]